LRRFPESLLESELFGHEEGAFTGSRRGGKAGLFEAAHTGTLFLDEIGDMPLTLQTRLLRVLQERQITRLGATAAIPVDVRVIGSLGGRRNVGCKAAATVHFSPAFCPIATAMALQTRQKLSSPGPLFASTPSAAQTPGGV
jgi:sigma54-dependent transcription regulator